MSPPGRSLGAVHIAPVDIDLGSARRERLVAALLWAGAIVALARWAQEQGWVGAGWPGLLAATTIGGWLGWRVATPMRGRLAWDGRTWQWTPPRAVTSQVVPGLHMALDLGPAALLRGARGQWCLITAHQAAERWHGVRLALRQGAVSPSDEARA